MVAADHLFHFTTTLISRKVSARAINMNACAIRVSIVFMGRKKSEVSGLAVAVQCIVTVRMQTPTVQSLLLVLVSLFMFSCAQPICQYAPIPLFGELRISRYSRS